MINYFILWTDSYLQPIWPTQRINWSNSDNKTSMAEVLRGVKFYAVATILN